MKITVYTKPECGQCENVKRWLTWAEIPFETLDGTEPVTLENLKSHGFASFPVVSIDNSLDNAFSGFNYDRLKEIKEHFDEE